MDAINNREIAILIWIIIALIWSLTHSSIRRSLASLFTGLFARVIVSTLTLMAIYVFFVVYALNALGLWDQAQLKNTLIWGFSVAIVSLFRINDIAKDERYFQNTIKDNLKLIIVLEFIIAAYPFHLVLELIIVPVSFFIGGALAVAQTDSKYESAEKALNYLLLAFGLVVIIHAGYQLITDINTFMQSNIFVDFYTPPLLSVLYLPFIYFLMVYMRYEMVGRRLSVFMDDATLLRHARLIAMVNFRFNLGKLDRWIKTMSYLRVTSKQEINDSIREIEAAIQREKNPVAVPLSRGWSPYLAREFLSSAGIVTDEYHSLGGDEWYASSPYKKLGNDILPNSIAYYIDGDKWVAKVLKLVLNVNVRNAAQDAQRIFIDAAKLLHREALSEEMAHEVETAIHSAQNITTLLRDKRISINKLEWGDKKSGGYSLDFVIEHVI
jgi:hypothetical protein